MHVLAPGHGVLGDDGLLAVVDVLPDATPGIDVRALPVGAVDGVVVARSGLLTEQIGVAADYLVKLAAIFDPCRRKYPNTYRYPARTFELQRLHSDVFCHLASPRGLFPSIIQEAGPSAVHYFQL
jgi:hypothetical protein